MDTGGRLHDIFVCGVIELEQGVGEGSCGIDDSFGADAPFFACEVVFDAKLWPISPDNRHRE